VTVGTVSRLHLRVPPGRSAFARARIEDALRLADPDDRLLVLRRLDLGRLAVRAPSQSWAERASDRVGAQRARAVHATTPGAASSDAVWFHSFDEARTLLLTDLMAGRTAAAWFWPLAVPGWQGARLTLWLPRLLAEATAHPVIEASLARAMLSVAGTAGLGVLATSLVDCPLPRGHDVQTGGQAGRPVAGYPERMVPPESRQRAHRMLLRLDARTHAEVWRILATLPAHSPARWWIARLTLIAVAPELASHTALLTTTTEALIDIATTQGEPVGPGNDAMRARGRDRPANPDAIPAQPRDHAGSPSRDVATEDTDRRNVDTQRPADPVLTPMAPPVATQDPGANPVAAPTETTQPEASTNPAVAAQPVVERRSDAAGLFLLLRPLVMMGFVEWLDARPDLAADGFGRALLHGVATRMRIAADDPVFAVLGRDTEADGNGLPSTGLPSWSGLTRPSPRPQLGSETHVSSNGTVAATPPATSGSDPARIVDGPVPPMVGLPIPDPAMARARPLLIAWRVGLDRWLRRTAGLRLTDVVHHQGWITDTGEHLSVRFRIDDADIRLRRRALDIDPGWVPWLGRVIRYHYRDEPLR